MRLNTELRRGEDQRIGLPLNVFSFNSFFEATMRSFVSSLNM